MPSEYNKISKFNHYQKSDKVMFFIYPDLECVIVRTNGCKKIPENSSTTKVSKHIPSAFVDTATISSFRSI